MRHRRLFLRIASAVLLVAVLHLAGWWWLSRQVAAGFDTWVAAQRALGRTVTATVPSLTGWPLAAGVSVADVSVAEPGWRWECGRLDVTLQLWRPGRIRLQPSGRQRLSAGSLSADLQATSLLLTLALPAGDNPVLDADGVVLELPFGRVTADRAEGRAVADGSVTRLIANVQSITLPPGPAYMLGPQIASLTVDAAVTGALPSPVQAGLAAWRDGGGSVRVNEMGLRWGPLTLQAAGTASLDRALQPLADLRVAMTGQDAALEAAVAQGSVQPRAALAVRAVLTLLSRASPTLGSPAGQIPVTVRDGSVSVSGFPVGRLPAVIWPAH